MRKKSFPVLQPPRLLPVLHPITLAVIERDIINAWSYGDDNIDKPNWMMLLDSVTFEIEKRKGDVVDSI